ncbi:PREDICTED: WAS/WASL-interacting protein family member 3-like [Atta colombica]|uniref:WAS/WASL-interacting protein family member 3-like n=1 Tax=Atta colombica TaxID=520822 RepID=UPI00084CCD61|nr:PREDICTED: WAS/WASL-interacting protein family member 3-like [Atta colombica]
MAPSPSTSGAEGPREGGSSGGGETAWHPPRSSFLSHTGSRKNPSTTTPPPPPPPRPPPPPPPHVGIILGYIPGDIPTQKTIRTHTSDIRFFLTNP